MLRKYNKIIFYVISSFFSFYLSYLVCRLWDLNVKGILTITIVLFIFSILLTKYCISKNRCINKKIRKKLPYIIIINLILSGLILWGNCDFFSAHFNNTEIEIKPIYDKQKISKKVISEIIINQEKYCYDNGDYIYIDKHLDEETLKIKVLKDNKLRVKLPKKYNVVLTFINDMGPLTIKDGNKITTLKFQKSSTKDYKIKSNTISDNYTFLRIIISYLLINYILIFASICFVNSNKYEKGMMAVMFGCLILGIHNFRNLSNCILYPDSLEYINYDFKRLLSLQLNGRVPIYSIIIRTMLFLFGKENYLEFVCIFQYFLWYISLIYLYKIIMLLTKKEKLSILGTFIYCLSHAIALWNNTILTESIALSGTLIFIYYIIKYIKTNEVVNGIISIVIAFTLTFLRPTSIIYILFLFIFFIMKVFLEKKNKRSNIKCLICSVISIVLVIIYAILFHKEFGIYSISDAVVRQDLYVSIQEGFYKTSKDKGYIKTIEKLRKKNPDNIMDVVYAVKLNYSLSEIKRLTNYSRIHNFRRYLEYIFRLITTHLEVKFDGYYFMSVNDKNLAFDKGIGSSFNILTFLHVYIIILISLIVFIKNWIKTKEVPWVYGGLFAFPLVIVLSSFIGTCAEFMRTAICCVPFVYLALILLFYDFFIKN